MGIASIVATGKASRLALALTLGGALAAPATAQSPPVPTQTAQATGGEAKAGPDTSIPLNATEPDPLAPPKSEEQPALAPGAPAAVATERPQKPPHAIVLEVRKLSGAKPAGGTAGDRTDRDALDAFYASGDGQPVWTTADGLSPKGVAVSAEIARAADFGLDPAAFDVPAAPSAGASPEALADAERRIGLAVLKYARHARGGRVDPTSISKNIDYQPRLFDPRSLIEAIAATDEADAYLKDLHPKHTGFRKLQKALLAHRAEAGAAAGSGRRSASDVETRILINMERWRWKPDDLGDFYVLDNVPEQLTRVVHDDKVIFTERIVVGKPDTQTPEFTAPMRFVIFHPSWGVPDGIKANELAPALRRASANSGWFFDSDSSGPARVLARHELRVFQNGRPVNPNSVNWSSVDVRQFQFSQPPSAKNVLGVVKFRFPNRFDVYMHDSPEKHYFAQSRRAYSHGCMRVQNPVKLAQVLLAHDKGWSAEKVQSFVSRGATADITLDKPIPVYVTYFTAVVDDEGKLKLFGDLYGRDSRLASALTGKSVSLAPIASAAERDPASDAAPAAKRRESGNREAASREGGRKDGRRQRQQSAAVKQGSVFNPFPGLSGN